MDVRPPPPEVEWKDLIISASDDWPSVSQRQNESDQLLTSDSSTNQIDFHELARNVHSPPMDPFGVGTSDLRSYAKSDADSIQFEADRTPDGVDGYL